MSDLLRITGMVTGLNTDDMVKQLLKVEQLKIDKVKQKKEYTQWQRDAYREISNLMRALKDEYFSNSKVDNNLRLGSSLNSYKALFGSAETSPYLNITARKDSTMLQNPITEIKMATIAKVSGTSLARPIEGLDMSGFDLSLDNDNTKITVTFNGLSKVIDITPMDDSGTDVADVVMNLQNKLDAAFGVGKISVSEVAGENRLAFSTANTNKLSIDYAYNAGLETIFGQKISQPIDLTNQNNKFKLSVSNEGTTTTKTITLETGDDLTIDQIISDLQAKLDSPSAFGNAAGDPGSSGIRVLNQDGRIVMRAVASQATASGPLTDVPVTSTTTVTAGVNDSFTVRIGSEERTFTIAAGNYTEANLLKTIQQKLESSFGSNKALVSLNYSTGKLQFDEIDSERDITASRQEDGGLAALKLDGPLVNRSNKIDMGATLAEIKKTFQTELIPQDSVGEDPEDEYDIEFAINGEQFAFKSSQTTLRELITTVNSNANAKVVMRYDEMTDSLSVESKDTGELAKVEIADVSGEGNLMAALGLNGLSDTGSDAEITFAGGTPSQYTITRSTNTFTFDEVTYELKQNYTGSLNVSLTTDTTKTLDLIKGFVEKYNEMITKVQSRLTEKRDRDYTPLTSEQKKEMSEDEVTLWETEAKKGLLRGDTLLQGIRSEMRSVLFEKVDGVQLSLFDIGITTTSDYTDGGKLVIDEDKLKAALRDKPQEVIQLFSQEETSQTSQSKGIAHRLYDVMEKYIRTGRDANGYKGLLLEKAGIEGDTTEFKNTIAEKIEDYDETINILLEKLSEKEERYYLMFARMERAISQMNTQTAWLSSQFGGSQ